MCKGTVIAHKRSNQAKPTVEICCAHRRRNASDCVISESGAAAVLVPKPSHGHGSHDAATHHVHYCEQLTMEVERFAELPATRAIDKQIIGGVCRELSVTLRRLKN